MRITTVGDVGIGNANPLARLHVSGGHVIVGEWVNGPSGTFPDYGRRLYLSGGPAAAGFNSQNSDQIYFARYNIGIDQSELRLNITDNCGTDQDAFSIIGLGNACGTSTLYFRFNSNGQAFKPGGGNWATLSDARLKCNISDFSDGLDKLLKIRPVNFQYNGLNETPKSGKMHVGVIAQELQEIFPDMVFQMNNGYLSVDPSNFTYILINSVKELHLKNLNLEAKILDMESKMVDLETKLNKLDQLLKIEAKKD